MSSSGPIHECAHILDMTYTERQLSIMGFGKNPMSEYAATHIREDFAETVAFYLRGRSVSGRKGYYTRKILSQLQ